MEVENEEQQQVKADETGIFQKQTLTSCESWSLLYVSASRYLEWR
jgi:hypothetical protein